MSGRGYEPRKIVYYEDEEVQVLIRERDTWRDQCEDLTGQLEQLTRHNGMMSDSLNEVGLERDNVKQENETLKKEKETMKLENEKLNRELARTREKKRSTTSHAVGRTLFPKAIGSVIGAETMTTCLILLPVLVTVVPEAH